MHFRLIAAASLLGVSFSTVAHADENLFGYSTGAETLPKGAGELYLFNTLRAGKGRGDYRALDTEIEGEYGITDRIQLSAAANFLTIDTHGLIIDGYLPKPIDKGPRFSGLELSAKFNVLAPALDNFGLAVITSAEWSRLDPHSGQRKTEWEGKVMLAAQKYLMQGQMVWVGNVGLKAGIEDRKAITGLDPSIEWPTTPETEIEVSIGTGLTYRILPGWFIGAEAQYATEFETEVGQERWSLFAGPTIHYGGKKFWATLTWFPQLKGGGERYAGQTGNLHLIEKTKNEVRLKLGLNF
jgi:hypothetical protein